MTKKDYSDVTMETGGFTFGAAPTPTNSHGIKECCTHCQLSSAADCPIPSKCHRWIGDSHHWEKLKVYLNCYRMHQPIVLYKKNYAGEPSLNWGLDYGAKVTLNFENGTLERGKEYLLNIRGACTAAFANFNGDETGNYRYVSMDYGDTRKPLLSGENMVKARLHPKTMPGRAVYSDHQKNELKVKIYVRENAPVTIIAQYDVMNDTIYEVHSEWSNVCDDIHSVTLDLGTINSEELHIDIFEVRQEETRKMKK